MGILSDALKRAIERVASADGETVEYSTEAVPSTWTSITGCFHHKGSSIEYNDAKDRQEQIQVATLTTSTDETSLFHGNWIRTGGDTVWSIRGDPGGQGQRIYNLVRAPQISAGPDRGRSNE